MADRLNLDAILGRVDRLTGDDIGEAQAIIRALVDELRRYRKLSHDAMAGELATLGMLIDMISPESMPPIRKPRRGR